MQSSKVSAMQAAGADQQKANEGRWALGDAQLKPIELSLLG